MRHEVEEIRRYRFDDREFRSLPEVGQHVQNEIGKILDSTPNRLHPADALAIFEAIVKHRTRLCGLLLTVYTHEDTGEQRSILDFTEHRERRYGK